MAKNTIIDPKGAIVTLNQNFNRLVRAVNQESIRKMVGQLAVDQIYNRTKSGYGVDSLGKDPSKTSKRKLHELSKLYIEYRRGNAYIRTNRRTGKVFVLLKSESTLSASELRSYRASAAARRKNREIKNLFRNEKPTLGPFGAPARSNLTLSGRMLEALHYQTRAGEIVLRVKNTSRRGDNLSNQELSNIQQKGDSSINLPPRPFLALTATEFRIIRSTINAIITREIKKIFG